MLHPLHQLGRHHDRARSVQRAAHESAFDERRTDRLVIRRFRAEDASTLAAYRSDPTVARYQSWDIPFTLAQAQAFIDSFVPRTRTRPGSGSSSRSSRQRPGRHVGDVAAGVDAHDPGWRRSA
jgi:RimJ/RimL family protein N-acetyltransferase